MLSNITKKAVTLLRQPAVLGILFLIVCSTVIHWPWLASTGIFTAHDWYFRFDESFREEVGLPQILLGVEYFTTGVRTPTFYTLNLIGGILSLLSNGYAWWERLLFFYPITFLGPLPIYLLLRRLFPKRTLPAVIGSLIFIGNPYILGEQASHLHISMGYLLSPLLPLVTFRFWQHPTFRMANAVIAAYTACIIYEARITYIVTLLTIIVLLGTKQLRTSRGQTRHLILYGTFAGLSVLALQMYWLLPFTIDTNALAYTSFTGRDILPSFSSLAHGFTLFHPYWTGAQRISFITNWPALLNWALPVFAFSALLLPRFTALRPKVSPWVWASIALVGIFLVKQENLPWPTAYETVFHLFPGFELFRESSKFYIIPALSYAVLVAYLTAAATDILQRWPRVRRLAVSSIVIVISALFFQTGLPTATGKVGPLFSPKKTSAVFAEMKDVLLQDVEFGRTLFIPDRHRFGFYSTNHPRVWATDLRRNTWQNFLPNERDITSFLASPVAQALLNFGAIKYVVIPPDPHQELYNTSGFKSQSYYQNLVDSIPGLAPVLRAGSDTVMWENKEANPHVYFASDVILTDDSLRDFRGHIPNQQSAFVFRNDLMPNQHEIAEAASTNVQMYPYSGQNIRLDSDFITSNLATTSPEEFSMYEIEHINQTYEIIVNPQKSNTYSITAHPVTNSDDPSPAEPWPLLTYRPQEQVTTLLLGDSLYELPRQPFNTPVSLGTWEASAEDTNYKLLTSAPSSATIENASFEDGLWGQVGDCNNFDGTSLESNGIKATLREDSTDGDQALHLQAAQHVACISTTLRGIRQDFLYHLTIDYKNTEGRLPQLKVIDRPRTWTHPVNLPGSTEWRTTDTFFVSPVSGSLALYLYQPTSGNTPVAGSSFFDNIRLASYRVARSGTIDLASHAINHNIATTLSFDSSEDFVITSPFDTKNLFAHDSFEARYPVMVKDCRNTNNTSLEANGIEGVYNNTEHTDGDTSLHIKAKRHIGCIIEPVLQFDATFDYLISLDYKHLAGHAPQAVFTSSQPEAFQRIEELPVLSAGEWQTYRFMFSPPPETQNIRFRLYVPGTGRQVSETLFDNIIINQVPRLPQTYLRSNNPPLRSVPAELVRTERSRHILTTPTIPANRLLVLSDLYHPSWRAFIRPASSPLPWWERFTLSKPGWEVPSDYHIKANGYVNGWIVPAQAFSQEWKKSDEPVQVIIEYWPQRYMNIGIIVSFLALVTCAIGAGLLIRRNHTPAV